MASIRKWLSSPPPDGREDADVTGELQALDAELEAATEQACKSVDEAVESFRAQLARAAEDYRGRRKRALIVDDDHRVLHAMRRAIAGVVDGIDEAAGLTSATALVQRNRYDLIVLDLRLGGDSAERLMHTVRNESLVPLVPVILVSGVVDPVEGAAIARRCGANAFLGKPYPPSRLVDTAKRLLEE